MPTERQPSRPKVAKQQQVDNAIYLRAYDITNSLDRAENKSWWDKALANIKRRPLSTPVPAVKGRLAPPINAIRALPAAANDRAMHELPHSESPVLARMSNSHGMALVPVVVSAEAPQHVVVRPRPVSWLLLAFVAAITAGLTFALIHFAWPSLATGGS